MRFDKKHIDKPDDHKEEKKLLTVEHIEKGTRTSKAEKQTLLGTKKPPTNKK